MVVAALPQIPLAYLVLMVKWLYSKTMILLYLILKIPPRLFLIEIGDPG